MPANSLDAGSFHRIIKNVRALIAAGADINARNKENKTPLNYAKENDQDRVVKLLLSYGAVEWFKSNRSSSRSLQNRRAVATGY